MLRTRSVLAADPAQPTRPIREVLVAEGRGWRLAACALSRAAHQVSEAMVPILLGVLIDRAVAPGDAGQLAFWLAVLFANFLVLTFAFQLPNRLMVEVYGHGENRLRMWTIGRILDPRGIADPRSAGELLTITTSDTFRVAGVSWLVISQASTISALAMATIALLVISVPLGLGIVAVTVALMAGMHFAAAPLEVRGDAEQAAAGEASSVITDLMLGLRVLQGSHAQASAASRYRDASQRCRVRSVRAARALVLYASISAAVSSLILAALVAAAGLLALTGQISTGELVTVVGLGLFLQGSLENVGTFASDWMYKRASARRISSILDAGHLWPATTVPGTAIGQRGAPMPTELALSFADLGLGTVVRPGDLVAIAPVSSAQGRFIADQIAARTTSGAHAITLNGVSLADLGPYSYRAHVLAVPHAATIFDTSVERNVQLTRTDLDVQPFLAAAGATELADEHPDTVGECGRRLSGGQRQRLLIARALAQASTFLVLEDPLTAVDAITEQHVADQLRAHPAGIVVITASPTLLAASHRIVAPTGISGNHP